MPRLRIEVESDESRELVKVVLVVSSVIDTAVDITPFVEGTISEEGVTVWLDEDCSLVVSSVDALE